MERRASGPDELPRITTVGRVLRYTATVVERDNLKREYLKRIKQAFEDRGIEIPFPQLTIH